jgi:uncharacterized protein
VEGPSGGDAVGRVQAIGRFPVKSMLGESPERAVVGPGGLAGDRSHGLLDAVSGKLASAKDPRAWAGLLDLRATWTLEPGAAGEAGKVCITLADGQVVSSRDRDVDARLSAALGREVRLCAAPPPAATYDYVWEVEGIAPEEVVTGSQTGTTADGHPVSAMPIALMAPGTFQDVAPVTILTTAALAAMAARHPAGDWDPVRFRSNLLLAVDGDEIVEDAWLGRQVAVGGVVLEVTTPAPRCVMTTLPQQGLPRDREVLRTVARHHTVQFGGFGRWACLGAYASVVEPGEVAVGDPVVVR